MKKTIGNHIKASRSKETFCVVRKCRQQVIFVYLDVDRKLFRHKRAVHLEAVHSMSNLDKYEKLYKMVHLLLEQMFKVGESSVYKCQNNLLLKPVVILANVINTAVYKFLTSCHCQVDICRFISLIILDYHLLYITHCKL